MEHTRLTPALAAFAAGHTIQPVGYVAGRPVFPIAGGSDDPPKNDPPADDPPHDDPPKDDPPKGYPDNTKVEDMQPAEQAAYWRDQARKHEGRNRDILKVTGGKYGDDLKAILDERETLIHEKRTDGEKAVEDAKNETRAEVRQEFGSKLAAAEFRAALAHVDGERRDQIIEGINLSAYLTDDGDVDTAKVQSYAATIAPADKGTGSGSTDFGAGRRPAAPRASGVAAGADMFKQSRKTTSTT